jgi:hypothetical protein
MFFAARSEIIPSSEQRRIRKGSNRAQFLYTMNLNNSIQSCEGNFFSNRKDVAEARFQLQYHSQPRYSSLLQKPPAIQLSGHSSMRRYLASPPHFTLSGTLRNIQGERETRFGYKV